MRTRRDMKDKKEDDAKEKEPEEEEVDIDLEDPEVQAATEKIQAGYKGLKTRRALKDKQEDSDKDKPPTDEGKDKIEPAEEEEVDIDLEDPEVQAATAKIQAGYKGMRTRRDMKDKKEDDAKPEEPEEEEVDIDLEDPEVQAATEKIQAGYKGLKTRRALKEKHEDDISDKPLAEENKGKPEAEEEEVDIDLEDPEVQAATEKIQAGYKGMRTRRDMKDKKEEDAKQKEPDEEEVDIDLEDPEVQAATAKIQAGYKGMRTRRDLQEKKPDTAGENATENENSVDIDLHDKEVQEATVKIQAGYRGMQTRKELKNKDTPRKDDDLQEGATELVIEERSEENNNDAPNIQANIPLLTDDDDGYNSPENPTWISSNKDGIQSSAPSSGTSSPAKHLDSAITVGNSSACNQALTLTGKAVELHEPSLLESNSSNQMSLDIEQDTDMIDDQTDVGDDEVAKALLTTQASKDLESDSKDVSLVLSYGEEENTESLTVIADVQAGIRSGKQNTPMAAPSALQEDNMPSMDTIGEESDVMLPDTVAQFVDQEAPQESLDGETKSSNEINEGNEEKHIKNVQLDSNKTVDGDSGGCKQSVPVIVDGIEDIDNAEQDLASITVRNDQEETLDDDDLGIVDEDKETAENLMSAPIDALELSHKLSQHEDDQLQESFRVDDTGAIPFELHPAYNDQDDSIHDIDSAMADEKETNEKRNDPSEVTIYHCDGSYNSEKVIVYLRERNILFKQVYVDLQENVQLSRWYLHINPRGEVPSMSLRVNKDAKVDIDPESKGSEKNNVIVNDSTKIIHTLEERYTLEDGYFPSLVPSSSNTSKYQEYIYYTALIDQVREQRKVHKF